MERPLLRVPVTALSTSNAQMTARQLLRISLSATALSGAGFNIGEIAAIVTRFQLTPLGSSSTQINVHLNVGARGGNTAPLTTLTAQSHLTTMVMGKLPTIITI
jgi:hypothetical protein